MGTVLKFQAVVLVFLLLSPIALFAGGQGESEGGSEGGLQTLNVAHMPYIHALPTYNGVETGYIMDTYGLDVNLMMFTSGPAINEALGANEWDVAVYGAPPGIMGGMAYNSKLIGFSVNDTATQELYVRPDNPIAAISDRVDGYPGILGDVESWEGQTILIPTSTTLHYILLATLDRMGMDIGDLEVVHMETPQAFAAFKAGQGDMVGTWEPFNFSAADEGWVKVSSGPIVNESSPAVIIASERALREKPEEIALWLRSYYDFTEMYGDDPRGVAEMMVEMQRENGITTPMDVAEQLVVVKRLVDYDFIADQFRGEDGAREADRVVQNLLNFFLSQGLINESQMATIEENDFVYPDVILSLE